jgi:hypothetical protein
LTISILMQVMVMVKNPHESGKYKNNAEMFFEELHYHKSNCSVNFRVVFVLLLT